MAKIFISYKRQDKDVVSSIVEEIRQKTGVDCWIDLEGIESGDQFQNVIIDAIDNADIVVFMLSKNFIAPYKDERTGQINLKKQTFPEKEVMYALRHNKRLIPVSIDRTALTDCKWLDFNCSGLDSIDWSKPEQKSKFFSNLRMWCQVEPHSDVAQAHVNTNTHPNNQKFVPFWKRKLSPIILLFRKNWIFRVSCLLGVAIVGTIIYIKNYRCPQETSIIEDVIERTPSVAIPADFVCVEGGILSDYIYNRSESNRTSSFKLDSFYICTHEVTQAEYVSVMKSNPSKMVGENLPVNALSVVEACTYCNVRSQRDGYEGFYTINNDIISINHNGCGYRLPTKQEWALASRVTGKPRTKYAGGDVLKDIAWYGGNSGGSLHEICQKLPNGRGLYDLNGNVSEWIWEKQFKDFNVNLGSDFKSYICFGEHESSGKIVIDETNGFRTVLVPSTMTNNNTLLLDQIKSVSLFGKE